MLIVVRDTGDLARVDKFMRDLVPQEVAVGVQSSAPPRVTTGTGDNIDPVDLIVIHEFGTSKIPERAPLRTGADANQATIADLLEAAVTLGTAGQMDANQALDTVAVGAEALFKNHITMNNLPPPNAPATIAAKGSSHPLIDTGQMVGSIRGVRRRKQ